MGHAWVMTHDSWVMHGSWKPAICRLPQNLFAITVSQCLELSINSLSLCTRLASWFAQMVVRPTDPERRWSRFPVPDQEEFFFICDVFFLRNLYRVSFVALCTVSGGCQFFPFKAKHKTILSCSRWGEQMRLLFSRAHSLHPLVHTNSVHFCC